MALDPSIPLQAKSASIGEMMGTANQLNLQDQQLDAGKLEIIAKKNQAVAQILSNTNDQAGWEAGIKQAQDIGIPTDHLPRQFDPKIRDNLLMRSLDVGKRLELQMEQAKMSETARHNKSMENMRGQQIGIGGMSYVDPETGEIVNNDKSSFGFSDPRQGTTPQVYKAMVNEDSKRRQAYVNNRPIVDNMNGILDQMEPNLNNFGTGAGADIKLGAEKLVKGVTGGMLFNQGATSGNNIEKGSNDLATEWNKFQHIPGGRAGVLGLQTILASKPGVNQDPQTNKDIISGIRSKITDYQLSEELAQKYRQASPARITDANLDSLDDAIKTLYPLKTVDPKTGAVTFNKDNVSRIRDVMDEAISNPQKFIDMAKKGAASGGAPNSSTPDATAAQTLPPKEQLEAGKTYQTKRGPATWDGNMFQPVRQ